MQTLCSKHALADSAALVKPARANSSKHVGRRSAAHRHIEPLHASAVGYARTLLLHARNAHRLRPAGTVRSAAAAVASHQSDFRRSHVRHDVHQRVDAKAPSYASAISGKRRLRANRRKSQPQFRQPGVRHEDPGALNSYGLFKTHCPRTHMICHRIPQHFQRRMATASTEVGPFFATPHHAPIELPEQVLTMIVLRLRDLTSAAADAKAGLLYAGLMGGIGSVCRSWRRLVKSVLMGDELAWLRVQGAAEAAECLSSFPHAKSLRIVGDAAAGEIVSALGSGSVARLAIAKNNVVRICECLDQLVGLRALYITECRNLAPTQLTSLGLGGTLRALAGSCAVSGYLRTPAVHG